MKKIQQYPTLKDAALKANVDPKTARKYRKLKGISEEKPRAYRTHPDAFAKHWPEIEAMLQRAPELQAPTILHYLIEQYPTEYKENQRRSLFRRLSQWRAEHGKNKPVIFRQELKPGRQSQSDWTHMGSLKITINGKPFKHLLFHFMLPYSRFETVMVCHAESLETLTKGFEQAVAELGGVAVEHRTDNLTAATQKMGSDRVFTKRWKEFLTHYHVQPSRNNPGASNENGSIEKSHHLFKNAVDQHLMIRQSRDFKTLEDYQEFLDKIKIKRNFFKKERIAEELKNLKPLPEKMFNEATILAARVNVCSTIQVLSVTYSVPSRLIGLWLKVVVSRGKIELMHGGKILHTLPRLAAGVLIDYRHIIDGLLRKPGAFESYQYQAYLYPNTTFRKAYDMLKTKGLTACNKRYLELLHLAKMYGEQDVTLALELLIEAQIVPTKAEVLPLLEQRKTPKAVSIIQPHLDDYDKLHTFVGGLS